MPRSGHRIQVQFPPDLESKVSDLARRWSRTREPLPPSQVIRACVERIWEQEEKAAKKEKRQ